MKLCHKCAGLLANDETENISGLLECECISGYVRGFEPELTRPEAIKAQIEQQEEWKLLYMRQNRSYSEITRIQARIDLLSKLRATR